MKRIQTLEQLQNVALSRKSVVCPKSNLLKKPYSAEFVLNYQEWLILDLIQMGLFEYEKPKEKKHVDRT